MRTSITFTPAFLTSPLIDENPPGPSQSAQQSQAPVTYSPAKHGTVAQFTASPDFVKFKQEYLQVIDRLTAFVHGHADQMDPPWSEQQKDKVRGDFEVLKQHLFEGNFFNQPGGVDHRPEMYGWAKETFHTFAEMLQDQRIPLLPRMTAVNTIADRARVCSGGVLSDLDDEIRTLQAARQGLKGIAHQWKKRMLDALILDHVKAKHAYGRGDEIHYVNAYYNALAKDRGLPERPDTYADNLWKNNAISPEQLAECGRQVDKKLKLKPTQLAIEVADQYRAKIEDSLNQEQIAADKINLSGQYQNLLTTTVKPLRDVYGEVPQSRYLEENNDDEMTLAYTGAKRPTALARHFLKAFQELGLIHYEKKEIPSEEIPSVPGSSDEDGKLNQKKKKALSIVLGSDGEGGRLKKLDDLFWIKDADKQIQELTAQALFQLSLKELLANIEKAEPEEAQERADLLRAVLERGTELLEATWPAEEALLGTWLRDFAAEMRERPSSVPALSKPAVFLAAQFNQALALDALLKAGGDKDATAEDGKTMLMLAARSGHTEVIETLIRHEAGINVADREGNTALLLAASNGHRNVLEALLKAGADLQAVNNAGHTGLYLALYKGHADAVRAFVEPLKQMPEAQRAALLAVKDGDGIPGLFQALYKGHAEAVRAFVEPLKQVPEAQRAKLLEAKDDEGTSGLYMALQEGKADAIRAFGKLLAQVPEAKRAKLLEAKDCEKMPGLYMALQNGKADAIRAFGKLLAQVPAAQRAALLGTKDARGIPGLYMALLIGHADAIEAFGELLDQVPEEQRAELVAAKYAGDPGLFIALQKGDPATIKAFGELLKWVPQAQRADLLAAKNILREPGLYRALQEGHADAIRAFGELLDLVPAGQRVELLTAKDDDGKSGLAVALEKGNLDALEPYMEMVKKTAPALSAEDRDDLLKSIKQSHVVKKRFGRWSNLSYYTRLKKNNSAFYSRFQEMENALKP